MEISEHEVEFFNCHEIVSGGPEACSLMIDGQEIEGEKFDSTALPYKTGILVPARKSNFFVFGYALCYIDFATLNVKFVSKVLPYMKLLRIVGNNAEIKKSTYGNETKFIKIID